MVMKDDGTHRTVTYYADKLCYSPKHLSTIVKHVCGRSPLKIINEHAIEKIKYQLQNTDKSMKELTDELSSLLKTNEIPFKRGIHWTTDAGYRETWGQVIEYREKGALCVEMEGVGLFTIANYRNCAASAMYVVSDVYVEDDWKLGWGENVLEEAAEKVIDMIVETVGK